MKISVTITRLIVGLLFIFSGLIKANDPLGLSYKMQEFFELWGMAQFNNWTLALSVLVIAFEIIAGVALLLGWQMKLFSWLLLLLILFFTFLTGYAYLSGKFKNCGCFGDCIPITAKTSFIKDLILSVLILYLFRYRHQIRPLFSSKANLAVMLAAAVLSFGIQWYTLNYLPFFDCLPYKKGNNINEQMKMPANAIPDSTVITFVYEKDGKLVKFTANEFPADFSPTTYKLVNRYDKVIRKGKNNEPPIKGFVLSGIITGEDSTQVILSQPYSVLIFFENFSPPVSSWKKEMEKVYKEARSRDIPVYLVTSRPDDAKEKIKGTVLQTLTVFKCDFTAVRTAARTSPTIYILKNGTIMGKWSHRESGRVIDELKRVGTER